MKKILSGITPSGDLTIGNYIGAIKNFVELQNNYEMNIFIADLHAITNEFDPVEVRKNTTNIAALYLACGLDEKKVNIFVQSQVKAHAQLGHILLCHTTIGELSRMTQFKDKSVASKNGTEFIRTGLLTYPTLMAADILLYDADLVPVGIDQKQHIELTRNIAQRFNNKYGHTFTLPEGLIPKQGAKIMSLVDPSKKMSKSDKNLDSMILLLDKPDVAAKKIMRAVTDSDNVIRFDIEKKPGISNLLVIYSELSNISIKDIEKEFTNKTYKDFKLALSVVVSNFLFNLQEKYNNIISSGRIHEILKHNATRAKKISEAKLSLVHKMIGLE